MLELSCYNRPNSSVAAVAPMSEPKVIEQGAIPDADIRHLGYARNEGTLQPGRRREMLSYIVEETLAGRSAQIKATTIAIAVFDRGTDFDQQSDPVVRLEARKLRRDLDNYYASAGWEDPLRIEVPKGAYVPKFSWQQHHEHDAESDMAPGSPEDAIEPVTESDSPVRKSKGVPIRLALAAMGVFGIFGLGLFWFIGTGGRDRVSIGPPFGGPSILVQTFETQNDDAIAILVAELLAQDITDALLKFSDIRAHTTFAHKTTETSKAIADSLQVKALYTVHGIVCGKKDSFSSGPACHDTRTERFSGPSGSARAAASAAFPE